MRKQMTALVLLSASALLLGCSSGVSDSPKAGVEPETRSEESPATTTGNLSIDHISSCSDLEPTMASYIDGLVEMEGNSVDEWGVSCTWTMAEGETDWENAREIDLSIVPGEFGNGKPDPAALESMGEVTLLEDTWVDELGGIAYSFEMTTGVVGAIMTTVWTPEYEVTVAGGRWENQPALDGAAALEVAKSVFG